MASQRFQTDAERRADASAGFEKLDDVGAENASGGTAGYLGQWMTAGNAPDGVLLIRTSPAYRNGNEINRIGLSDGEQVQAAGHPVRGAGPNGSSAVFSYVCAPKFGRRGYVDEKYPA